MKGLMKVFSSGIGISKVDNCIIVKGYTKGSVWEVIQCVDD